MKPLALLFFAITVGCTSSPTNPGAVDIQLTLGPGLQAPIGSAGASIRFVGVTTDSRCPAAAICVWAGDAVARFEMVRVSNPETLELHTTLPPNQGEVAGFRIHLLELAPYPIADPIPAADYRATVRVTR